MSTLTYLALSCAVLLPVGGVGLAVLVRAGRAALAAAVAALGVLVLLTVVFDTVIVGTGIVGYDAGRILGLQIGAAPVEDFAYPLAAALALPALWLVLPRRRPRG